MSLGEKNTGTRMIFHALIHTLPDSDRDKNIIKIHIIVIFEQTYCQGHFAQVKYRSICFGINP